MEGAHRRRRPMPPKQQQPLRQLTRKEALALPQNARFNLLSNASQLLASHGSLELAAHYGSRALKVGACSRLTLKAAESLGGAWGRPSNCSETTVYGCASLSLVCYGMLSAVPPSPLLIRPPMLRAQLSHGAARFSTVKDVGSSCHRSHAPGLYQR